MIRSALAGLRGRLLLAFVATSAVTLLVAAGITLSPLQSQLRDQSIDQLQTRRPRRCAATSPTTVDARRVQGGPRSRGGREGRPRSGRPRRPGAGAGARPRWSTTAYELRNRIPRRARAGHGRHVHQHLRPGARVPVRHRRERLGPERRVRSRSRSRCKALREGTSEVQFRDDVASFAMPVYDRDGKIAGVVVAERNLTEVSSTVALVRNALLHGRGDRPRGGDRARARALEHAHAPARPPAALGPADHDGRPGGARARWTAAATRSATWRARSGACRRSCAARRRRGARSSPPPRTSCARR